MRHRGFTLVETVMVLALAGLLVYGGAVTFRGFVPKLRLQAGVWEVRSSLNQARFKAIWRGTAFRVRFVPGGYRLEAYDGEAGTWRLDRAGVFEGVAVRSNNDPAFHPEGTVSNLATITVANSRGAYRITVAISGRIKTVKVA
jgi:prepilin-type N-terminal cleavage/methylation domain-containing protein